VDNLDWSAPHAKVATDPAQAHAYVLAAAPALAGSPAEIRRSAVQGTDRHAAYLLGLLHSFMHCALRDARDGSGYDLHSFCEYLFPADLSGLLFVNSRKDFTMGGLKALYRYCLPTWFERAANSSVTCIFDPVCSERFGSCHGCLQLPLGCETFNHGISRAYLHGGVVNDFGGETLLVRKGYWT